MQRKRGAVRKRNMLMHSDRGCANQQISYSANPIVLIPKNVICIPNWAKFVKWEDGIRRHAFNLLAKRTHAMQGHDH